MFSFCLLILREIWRTRERRIKFVIIYFIVVLKIHENSWMRKNNISAFKGGLRKNRRHSHQCGGKHYLILHSSLATGITTSPHQNAILQTMKKVLEALNQMDAVCDIIFLASLYLYRTFQFFDPHKKVSNDQITDDAAQMRDRITAGLLVRYGRLRLERQDLCPKCISWNDERQFLHNYICSWFKIKINVSQIHCREKLQSSVLNSNSFTSCLHAHFMK